MGFVGITRTEQEGQRAVLDLFETADVIAMTLDRDGRITYCNGFLSDLVGWDRDELVGRDYFATCEPYRPAGAMDELLAAVVQGGPSPFNETELHTRTKGVRIIAWSDTPIRDASGEVVGTTSIGQDVTARRRAQMRFGLHLDFAHALAAARTIEEAGRGVLDAIAGAVYLRSGTFWTVAGDRLRAMAVHPPPSAGDAIAEPVGPRRGEGAAGKAWACGESVWEGDYTLAIPAIWDGAVMGVLEVEEVDGISRDADVRRSAVGMGNQIAQFLHRHRGDARRRAILQAAFDCIILLDTEGNVAELNPATERSFGRTRDELIGMPFAGLVPGSKAADEAVLDRHVHATGLRPDGTDFPAEYLVTIIDLEDAPAHVVYLRDVTERVRTESELRLLVDEQAALRRVATLVAAEDASERIVHKVTEEVGRLLASDMATMVRFDREHEATIVSDWNANAVLEDPVGMVVSTEDGTALSQVRHTGLPSRVDAYEDLAEEEHAAHLLDLGIHAGIAAPIVLGGRLWGAVSATTTGTEPFPEGAEQRLAQFAELVAQALANAEARSELAASRMRMVQAADHERRRLERNLHDGAQQRLVGLSLALRLAEDRVERDPQGAAHLLTMARTELGEALDELRELARGSIPPCSATTDCVPRSRGSPRAARSRPTSRATSGGWTKPSRSRPTSRSRKRSPTSPSTRRPRAPTSRQPCVTAGSRSPSPTTVSEERIPRAARACKDFSTGSRPSAEPSRSRARPAPALAWRCACRWGNCRSRERCRGGESRSAGHPGSHPGGEGR